jgi:hypothetical protein
MDSAYFEALIKRRKQWLGEEIRQLSVDTLEIGAYTLIKKYC